MENPPTTKLSIWEYCLILLDSGKWIVVAALFAVTLLWNLGSNNIFDFATWPRAAGAVHGTATQPVDAVTVNPGKVIVPGHIHAILAATTALLIFANTLQFMYESRNPEHSKDAKRRLKLAFIITAVCELITLAWFFTLIIGHPRTWPKFIDEYIPLTIFILFIVIDWLTYSVYRKQPDDGNEKVRAAREFAFNQILLVDLPVVVGICSSLLLGHYFTSRFLEVDVYLEAFFTGAVVMHLAASQMIFIILSAKKEIVIAKTEKMEYANGNHGAHLNVR